MMVFLQCLLVDKIQLYKLAMAKSSRKIPHILPIQSVALRILGPQTGYFEDLDPCNNTGLSPSIGESNRVDPFKSD